MSSAALFTQVSLVRMPGTGPNESPRVSPRTTLVVKPEADHLHPVQRHARTHKPIVPPSASGAADRTIDPIVVAERLPHHLLVAQIRSPAASRQEQPVAGYGDYGPTAHREQELVVADSQVAEVALVVVLDFGCVEYGIQPGFRLEVTVKPISISEPEQRARRQ